LDVYLPLDHHDELTVAEYLDSDKLASKLAMKKFESDLSQSESETLSSEEEMSEKSLSSEKEVI